MPVILATQEAELEGSRFEVSPDKSYEILSQKQVRGLAEWLK
jgi:hypothetical protein